VAIFTHRWIVAGAAARMWTAPAGHHLPASMVLSAIF